MAITSPAPTLRAPSELDYYHIRSVQLPVHISPLDAWNIITADSGLLMRTAFQIRDAISALFGVKRIGGFTGAERKDVHVGDHLDFFLVEHSDPPLSTANHPRQTPHVTPHNHLMRHPQDRKSVV